MPQKFGQLGLTFSGLHHLEYRVADPVNVGNQLVELFGGEADPPSPKGSVTLKRLNGLGGVGIELKAADAQNPAGGSVLAVKVGSNTGVAEALVEAGINPDTTMMDGPDQGWIFFDIGEGDNAVHFHTIVVK